MLLLVGYVGSDFFTFRLRIKSTAISPSTVAIVILPTANSTSDAALNDAENGLNIMKASSSGKKKGTTRNVGALNDTDEGLKRGESSRGNQSPAPGNSNNNNSNKSGGIRRPSLIDTMMDTARTRSNRNSANIK